MELIILGLKLSTFVLIVMWLVSYLLLSTKEDSSGILVPFILTLVYLIGWMITISTYLD